MTSIINRLQSSPFYLIHSIIDDTFFSTKDLKLLVHELNGLGRNQAATQIACYNQARTILNVMGLLLCVVKESKAQYVNSSSPYSCSIFEDLEENISDKLENYNSNTLPLVVTSETQAILFIKTCLCGIRAPQSNKYLYEIITTNTIPTEYFKDN